MDARTCVTNDDEWLHVVRLLPPDLDSSCRNKLAMERFREIRSATDLLRLCLAYGVCDLSLRQTAAWASALGLGQLSNVAVLKRLRSAGDWLGYLVGQWLADHGLTRDLPSRQLRIVDGSVVRTPGEQPPDYRLHLSFDPVQMRITDVDLTPTSQGESLHHHIRGEGEVLLADRGYGRPPQIAAALARGAHVVVRIAFQAVPLETKAGTRVNTLALLKTVAAQELGDWPVFLRQGQRRYALRLVAVKKSQAAIEQTQARVRRKAQSNGTTKPDPRALQAAAYTYVLTDLSAADISAAHVLELYRLRWQIELAFKRLKSLLQLNLRARSDDLARTYLLANLLGALLIDELSRRSLSFFPWGFPLFPPAAQLLAAP